MILRRPTHRRTVFAWLAVLLAGLPTVVGRAQAGAPHPAEVVVRDLVAEVARVVEQDDRHAGDDALVAALVPVLASRTDIALIGRLVLGRHWRTAAPEERAAYQALFRGFMLRSLAGRLRPHAGANLGTDDSFTVLGARPVGRGDVIVATEVTPPGRPPLHIDWRLRETAGRYVIIDLVVEGVSLLVTQRQEFSAVIERGGLQGLLDELRARAPTSI